MSTATAQDNLKKKIDELNRTAWAARISESDKAHENSTEAGKLSRKINYKKGLADSLTVEGFGHIRRSDFKKASDCLTEAFSIYQSLDDQRGIAVVYEYLGIIQRYKGDGAAALQHIFKALDLSRQTAFTDNEITNLYQLGVTYRHLAKYDKALDYLFDSLALARSSRFEIMEAYNLHVIGSIYFETGDYEQALNYYNQGLAIRRQAGDKWGEAGSLDNIGFTHLKLNHYEQAIDCCKKSLAITQQTGDKKGQSNALIHLAEGYKQVNEHLQAVAFSEESLAIRKESGDKRGVAEILLFLAELQTSGNTTRHRKKQLQYLADVLIIAEEMQANDLLSKTHHQLYEHYKAKGHFKKGMAQLELYIALETELHKNAINQKIVTLETTQKAEETKREADAVRLRNEELTRLNTEIEEQKLKVEMTLKELRATQAQLIQREKMASLGELTAGIAHEIQNPLNFVNNFSEINRELADELLQELDDVNPQEAKQLTLDIRENSKKILSHGKRADAIVKGMLQHSRASTGVKQLTDINTLADEYLRLSYQAMRSKDKAFQVVIETDFDKDIGKINVVPQEIGRVLLNLFQNAFYAVLKKKEQLNGTYEPVVSVSTFKRNDQLEIMVKDNGTGMSSKIAGKIFQPFFTTKPTGEGTGLGLSLSYDIITKGHGGELRVESREGEGTAFIIMIPTT